MQVVEKERAMRRKGAGHGCRVRYAKFFLLVPLEIKFFPFLQGKFLGKNAYAELLAQVSCPSRLKLYFKTKYADQKYTFKNIV